MIKQTLYSDTEITLRAVITTSSACDSTSIYTKQSGPRSGRKVFFPGRRKEIWQWAAGKGTCHCSGVRRGAEGLLSYLILAWTFLLCGSSVQKFSPQGFLQEGLKTRAAHRCQHGSQAASSIWSYLPLPAAAATLISTSALAEEQSPFQNMAQLLHLDFAWKSSLCFASWPRLRPVLDLLPHSCNFLPVALPKAAAPVPPFPNFLFSLGLLEHLSLCFPCWASLLQNIDSDVGKSLYLHASCSKICLICEVQNLSLTKHHFHKWYVKIFYFFI